MQEFIAYSENAKSALRSAHLIRNLMISTLIIGKEGSGKKALSSEIMSAQIVDAKNRDILKEMLKNSTSLIIENFDCITNYDTLDIANKKIVALSKKELSQEIVDRFFAVVIRLSDLKERVEDIKPLAELFLKEAKKNLGLLEANIDFSALDITQNANSLKKSIYFELLKKNLKQEQIESILEEFLKDKINGNNAYRDLLPIFEKPLFKKGLELHRSQLKLSDVLGLNRNTIRKKLKECGYEE